jgi:hypothetical protein
MIKSEINSQKLDQVDIPGLKVESSTSPEDERHVLVTPPIKDE